MNRVLGWIVVPIVLAGAIALATPVTSHNLGFDEDGRYYGAMTLHFAGKLDPQLSTFAHEAPYAARILTPWLAARVPVPFGQTLPAPLDAMRLLGLAQCVVALALVFEITRQICGSERAGFFGQLLYAGVFWTIKFAAFSPAYIDSGMEMFLLLGMLCLALRRYWLFVPALALAVVQKETALVLLPAALYGGWHTLRATPGRFATWALAAIGLPLGAMVWAAAVLTTDRSYSAVSVVFDVIRHQFLVPAFWPIFLIEIFSGLGLIPLLCITFRRELAARLKRDPSWALALVLVLSAIFGGVDKGRLLLPFVAVVTPLLAACAAPLLEQLTFARGMWFAIVTGLHGYLGHQFEPMGVFESYLARMAPIHADPAQSIGIGLARIIAVGIVYGVATGVLQPRKELAPAATQTTAA